MIVHVDGDLRAYTGDVPRIAAPNVKTSDPNRAS